MLNCHPKRLDSFVYLLTAYENACLFTFLSLLVFLFFFYFCVLTDKTWHLIGSLCILKITNEGEHFLWIACSYFCLIFFWVAFFFLTPHWFAVALCYWRKLTFCPFCLSIFSHLSFFFWFCWCSVFWSLEAYNFWVLFSQTHQWGGCLILIRALMFDTNTMLYNISRVTWFEPGVCFWRIPFWPRFVLIGWSYCLFRIYN